MSLLSRFVSKAPQDESPPEGRIDCGHRELAPRWDSAADMGDKEKVTSYTCTGCGRTFSPDEARTFLVS